MSTRKDRTSIFDEIIELFLMEFARFTHQNNMLANISACWDNLSFRIKRLTCGQTYQHIPSLSFFNVAEKKAAFILLASDDDGNDDKKKEWSYKEMDSAEGERRTYANLVQELKIEDNRTYKEMMRMDFDFFKQIVQFIDPYITPQNFGVLGQPLQSG